MKCQKCLTQNYYVSPVCSFCGNITVLDKSIIPATIPWETSLREKSPLQALFISIKNILLLPSSSFSDLAHNKNILPSAIFALFCIGVGLSGQILWGTLEIFQSSITHWFGSTQSSSFSFISAPATQLIQLFISALYVHFTVFVFRAQKATFSQTLKVVFYAQAAYLFFLIPFAGGFISTCVYFYLLLKGASCIHITSSLKMVLILLSPVFLFVLIVFLLLAAFSIALAAQPSNLEVLRYLEFIKELLT
ncbi:YIP1 family protein [Chitinispirillales bacterium ANBcel5]|uniref:YIP1 family protein n=1 Tax=Cellulosispirillum alkaliphilum TaxID=3039283 RepID=UPI002A549C0A|nr:YIP1 family protein [Chitinispirillales bacterium ANBcel5]